MPVKDTPNRFGLVSIANHWITALLVLGMIALGLYMSDLPRGDEKLQLIGLHKSFGIIILGLALLRLLWRLGNPLPALLGADSALQRTAARVIHFALFALLFLLPLSGWIMSSAGNHPVSVFGLFTLPELVGQSKAVGGAFKEIHEVLAWTLITVVALHFLAAIKHHFMDGDATLRRMLGRAGSDA